MACQALKDGLTGLLLPGANYSEARLVGGLTLHPLVRLQDALCALNGNLTDPPPPPPDPEPMAADHPDFQDVRGQHRAKRALEIAAAGGHNIILIGPPGVGKTMLAKRLPSILPPMTQEEVLETSRLQNLAGMSLSHLIYHRPFRSPHHTASDVAIVGGGTIPMPGEISLAHNGVLFLDELYEFKRSAIETLRQPLEEGRIRIARAKQTLEYPADFMLVAAMNPCFCGYYSSKTRGCTCSKRALQYYRQKTGGPLLERIDLHVEAEVIDRRDWNESAAPGESSAMIRDRVIKARLQQTGRFAGSGAIRSNARIPDQQLDLHCGLDAAERRYLLNRIDQLQLSARAYSRILKVSRTIADLAGSPAIDLPHLAEAISFRCLDQPVAVSAETRLAGGQGE
jgi:magnesium chelatase family protein